MAGMLLYATLGLSLVLAWRKPARRLFGAGPAFSLWLLPPLLTALPWLPALPATWTLASVLVVLPAPASADALVMPMNPITRWPLLLWLTGTAVCLLRLLLQYSRLLRQSSRPEPAMVRVLQADLGDLDPRRLRLHAAGPAVLWAPRSLLLLPADFLERFNADQRRLVLQHERTHLRRGDAWWSLLAELAAALLWFHPLAWLALPRLRLDQELACDEQVLRHSPQDAIRYARTLLHSRGLTDSTAALIPWLAEPQLKERLSMIERQRHGVLRRRIGFIGLAALMAGSALLAQAATPVRSSQQASADLDYNSQRQPHYPQDAIVNRQQGLVVLRVLVAADGTPARIEVEPATHAAPSLVKAAAEAAAQWRFNPALEAGRPIAGYARVPVQFSLDPLPPASPHASSST